MVRKCRKDKYIDLQFPCKSRFSDLALVEDELGEKDKEDIYQSSEEFENRDMEEAEVPDSIPWKDYYHGNMSKGQAEASLEGKHEGTFLIRANNGGYRFTRVPHKDGGKAGHILLNQDPDGKYYFVRSRVFQRIEDLVLYYQRVDTDHKYWLGEPLLHKEAQGKCY